MYCLLRTFTNQSYQSSKFSLENYNNHQHVEFRDLNVEDQEYMFFVGPEIIISTIYKGNDKFYIFTILCKKEGIEIKCLNILFCISISIYVQEEIGEVHVDYNIF